MTENLYLDDETFVVSWKQAEDGKYPLFPGIDLNAYRSLETELFQSFGGRIPVLHMKERTEFEQLICAIFYKGEKREIPLSMGALTIKGWKDLFGQSHRAILLSDGFYSAVQPEEIGLEPEEWKAKSFLLRRAHECAHYYTLRAYGFMNNALKDELIADAMGIIEAFGEYRHDLFLKFMGLEHYPEYRWGGRLQNYRPRDREMSDGEFKEFQRAAFEASEELNGYLKENLYYIESRRGNLELLKKLAEIDGKSFETRSRNGRLFSE